MKIKKYKEKTLKLYENRCPKALSATPLAQARKAQAPQPHAVKTINSRNFD